MASIFLACAFGAQEEPDKAHVPVYRKVAPAVVFVQGGGQQGSGVIIDPSGIILTSPTACGAAKTVTVLTKGHKLHRGRVMGRVNEKDLVLVKIDAENLPAVELGDSDAVKVGQISYVLGDSFHSIFSDDQPAISLGAISGLYSVSKTHSGARYTGRVIETSAAVNPNQDGGPLVDRHGRLLGIVTLNYDESKFTGIAIPVNEIKKDIERIRGNFESGVTEEPPPQAPKGAPAWLGVVEVKPVEGGLEIVRLSKGSPAEKAGLLKGDILTQFDASPTPTRAALDKAIARKSAGDAAKLTFLRDGDSRDLSVTLSKKVVY